MSRQYVNAKSNNIIRHRCYIEGPEFHNTHIIGISSIGQLDEALQRGALDIMLMFKTHETESRFDFPLLIRRRGNEILYGYGNKLLLVRPVEKQFKTVRGLVEALYNAIREDGAWVPIGSGWELYDLYGVACYYGIVIVAQMFTTPR